MRISLSLECGSTAVTLKKIIDQAKNKEYLPKRIHDGVVPLYIEIKYFWLRLYTHIHVNITYWLSKWSRISLFRNNGTRRPWLAQRVDTATDVLPSIRLWTLFVFIKNRISVQNKSHNDFLGTIKEIPKSSLIFIIAK